MWGSSCPAVRHARGNAVWRRLGVVEWRALNGWAGDMAGGSRSAASQPPLAPSQSRSPIESFHGGCALIGVRAGTRHTRPVPWPQHTRAIALQRVFCTHLGDCGRGMKLLRIGDVASRPVAIFSDVLWPLLCLPPPSALQTFHTLLQVHPCARSKAQRLCAQRASPPGRERRAYFRPVFGPRLAPFDA